MSVLLYEPGLTALLNLPTSPVTRYVTAKAELVAANARQNVQTNFRTRTGNLHNSVGVFPRENVDGVAYEIGTEGAPYGRVLELGGTEHIIEAPSGRVLASLPENPDPLLAPRFRVFHPGNPPRPWLRPALEAVFLGG